MLKDAQHPPQRQDKCPPADTCVETWSDASDSQGNSGQSRLPLSWFITIHRVT